MKSESKRYLKRVLIINGLVIVVILVLGSVFIASDCTVDCAERGELLGQGLARFVVFINVLMALWWHLKGKKKI